MYFENCDNLKAFVKAIKYFQHNPYDFAGPAAISFQKYFEAHKPVIICPEMEGIYIADKPILNIEMTEPEDLEKAVFSDACKKAIELFEKDNRITKEPPLQASNAKNGLNGLLLWAIKCIRAIKRPPTNSAQADEEPESDPAASTKTQTGEKRESDVEWSKEMSKSVMMTKLSIDGYWKFNKFAENHGIQKVGDNRQLFQIRIDKMNSKDREKLEKK